MRRTPRDPFEPETAGPLHVEVQCCRCASKRRYEIPWALVHPEPDACDAEGWDGVLLGRVIECSGCGAADEYELTPMARLLLAARILASTGAFEGDRGTFAQTRRRSQGSDPAQPHPPGARLGVATLPDGTVVRRPTQALDPLRRVTTVRPDSAEAWRRLGNACHHYGREIEAEEAWRQAVKVDLGELEAAFRLIARYVATAQVDAATAIIQLAVERWPLGARNLDAGLRSRTADTLAFHLESLVLSTVGPVTLEAAWTDGGSADGPVVRMGAVDLRGKVDWHRLVVFLRSGGLIALRLTADESSQEGAELASLLLEDPFREYTPSQPFVRASARVGRNDPCVCGSGKPLDECCAGTVTGVRSAS
jgi:SEC-C motif